MEVVDNCYEFKFAEIINKAGGITRLMNELDKQTLYEVEMLIRNRRPWSDDDMERIRDKLDYEEYQEFTRKNHINVRKEVEERSGDNIYFGIHDALCYNRDIDTDEFVMSLVDSKFYRPCYFYATLGGPRLRDKIDDRLKKHLDDINVVEYLRDRYNDVVYLERAYELMKRDSDLWRLVCRYYRDGETKKALAMRPCRCEVHIENPRGSEKKMVMNKYPGINLTIYSSGGAYSGVEIINPGTNEDYLICSFTIDDPERDLLDQLEEYEVYFV